MWRGVIIFIFPAPPLLEIWGYPLATRVLALAYFWLFVWSRGLTITSIEFGECAICVDISGM